MSKYELTISKDYVPNWTIVDAVRELFQNALDQQTISPGNEMFFKYEYDEINNPEYGTLRIGNKESVLEARTLLLGGTTKADDDRTIGKFGEGYKIATLVLTRLGKKVEFYNYGAREVWRPRFVNSRRYGAEILTFFVDKKYVWQKVPNNNLTIEVYGVTPEEYKDIVASNLHLQDKSQIVDTEFGEILLDDVYKGKIYVNGLLVCDYEPYRYGYNFKPQHLKLDRDRKLVSDFELKWLSSKMWSAIDNPQLILELIEDGAADVAHINSAQHYKAKANMQNLATEAASKFIHTHGSDAYPVSDQQDMQIAKAIGRKAVLVKPEYRQLIVTSGIVTELELPTVKSIQSMLEDWLIKYHDDLPIEGSEELQAIINMMEE